MEEYKKNMNCIQSALSVVLEKHHLPEELLFLQSWGFTYSDHIVSDIPEFILRYQSGVGRKIRLPRFHDEFDILDEYIGIKLQELAASKEEIMDIVEHELLNGRWLLFEIDIFYCPWSIAFENKHNIHYLVVTNIKNDNIECIDRFLSNRTYYLGKADLLTAYKKGFMIDIKKDQRTRLMTKDMVYRLSSFYREIGGIATGYDYFIYDISNAKNMEDFFDNSNVQLCTLMMKIEQIVKNYMGVSYMLKTYYGQETSTEIVSLSTRFDEMKKQWQTIKNLFVKLFYLQHIDNRVVSRITEILECIKSEEIRTYDEINSIIACP